MNGIIELTHLMFTYIKTPGSTVPFPDDTTTLDLFCCYFTDEVWDFLVPETNDMFNKLLGSGHTLI